VETFQARAFLAVAREGSVSRAAERLHRSQPAVTMAVKGLERELRARLIERIPRGVRLTRAGQSLRDLLAPAVEAWEAVPGRLQETLTGEPRGPVRIGAGEAALLYLLPKSLKSFRADYPDVEIVLRHLDARESFDLLRAGELDFAIRSLPEPPADLDFRPILTADRVLVMAHGHPLARARRIDVEALSTHPFVLPRRGSTTRTLIEGMFARAGVSLNVAVEAGGWETVKRYVAARLGISLIPAFCVRREDRLKPRRIPALFGTDTYGIVTRRKATLSRAAAKLIERLEVRPSSRPSAHGP
jgi:DNA-binding transcriptional LysR family regulator